MFITSFFIKRKLQKNGIQVASYYSSLYVFRENDGRENCAQLIEEEFYKMFGINDEHDCNVVSMNSMNLQNANVDFTSHQKKVSYKQVNFCGVERLCEDMPYRDDRFCKKHKHD